MHTRTSLITAVATLALFASSASAATYSATFAKNFAGERFLIGPSGGHPGKKSTALTKPRFTVVPSPNASAAARLDLVAATWYVNCSQNNDAGC